MMKNEKIDYDKKSFTGLNYYNNHYGFTTSKNTKLVFQKVWLAHWIDNYKRLEAAMNKIKEKSNNYSKIRDKLNNEIFDELEKEPNHPGVDHIFYYYGPNNNFFVENKPGERLIRITFSMHRRNFSWTVNHDNPGIKELQTDLANSVFFDNKEKYEKINDKLKEVFHWSYKAQIMSRRYHRLQLILDAVLNEILEFKVKNKIIVIKSGGVIDIKINDRQYVMKVEIKEYSDIPKFYLQNNFDILSIEL